MKRSWKFGLLALGIAGIATYDVFFFKNNNSQQPPAIRSEAMNPEPLPTVAPAPGSPAPENALEQKESASLPPISKEELLSKALHPFVIKDSSILETEKAWPNRNPFAAHIEPKAIKSNPKEIPPLKAENPTQANTTQTNTMQTNTMQMNTMQTNTTQTNTTQADLPEPECVFVGTLIDQDRRLALVNGASLSVGARIGSWQIDQIESNYIILQSGERTRRIELSAGRQDARKEHL
jgi:hypothetical protein